ncbi:MAG: peptide-methionine (S)-S-oxide reductase MsrA [Alphaproteobacteria bacterium]|nr:peptide-methionine (S)-S-oxide reductase MsrA [Alphaproteobacteria bacterium]
MRKLFLSVLLALIIAPTATLQAQARSETAVFAGGCFWCVESNFDKVKGVTETISGYAGGTLKNPTYENHEGYQEAEKITYDPDVVSYADLVAYFLRSTDVLDDGGQFCDRGNSYISVIFPMDDQQKQAAEKAVADAEKALGKKIVTPIRPFTTFTAAEDYHQNYYLGQNRVLTRFGWIKQADAYEDYRKACGRDARINQLWGKAAYTFGH